MSLELSEVRKSYGSREVLRGVSFTVDDGELMVLLGPSGAGKTKTLEIVAGVEEPDSGKVLINGRDVAGVPARKRGIGFVFQDYSLFPHKTVFENIAFGLRVRKDGEVKRKVEDIAEEVRILELLDRYPGEISGGEKQRVALARALVIEPDLLLFDEPLGSLDQNVREELRKVLKEIQVKEGITTVFVTHDYTEAIALADRIGILKRGRIIQFGDPDDIFYRPVSREVAEFTGMTNIFEGRVVGSSKAGSLISIDGLEIKVDGQLPVGGVTVCIRPESIMFLRPDRKSTFENSFKGRVAGVESFGSSMHRIAVDAGKRFFINVPNHVVEKMGLATGKEVEISLKKEKIHVLTERRA
ncbi:MAG: ABC transporter ATP-binding protein [Methanobacteriota archaeon]|nr:MAG: ABC transporter ATP-binding protein [Euryarchaeota archaeon]